MDSNLSKKSSDWILVPSTRFPGKLYYFNSSTGEALWTLNDEERKKIQHVNPKSSAPHQYPEPNSTPDDIVIPQSYSNYQLIPSNNQQNFSSLVPSQTYLHPSNGQNFGQLSQSYEQPFFQNYCQPMNSAYMENTDCMMWVPLKVSFPYMPQNNYFSQMMPNDQSIYVSSVPEDIKVEDPREQRVIDVTCGNYRDPTGICNLNCNAENIEDSNKDVTFDPNVDATSMSISISEQTNTDNSDMSDVEPSVQDSMTQLSIDDKRFLNYSLCNKSKYEQKEPYAKIHRNISKKHHNKRSETEMSNLLNTDKKECSAHNIFIDSKKNAQLSHRFVISTSLAKDLDKDYYSLSELKANHIMPHNEHTESMTEKDKIIGHPKITYNTSEKQDENSEYPKHNSSFEDNFRVVKKTTESKIVEPYASTSKFINKVQHLNQAVHANKKSIKIKNSSHEQVMEDFGNINSDDLNLDRFKNLSEDDLRLKLIKRKKSTESNSMLLKNQAIPATTKKVTFNLEDTIKCLENKDKCQIPQTSSKLRTGQWCFETQMEDMSESENLDFPNYIPFDIAKQDPDTGKMTDRKRLDIETLREMSTGGSWKRHWFIVLDEYVVFEEVDFMLDFVERDLACRIAIPRVVQYEVYENKKLMEKLSSPDLCNCVYFEGNEYTQDDDIESMNDGVLKFCLALVYDNYHTILITADEELRKQAKNKVICFTLQDLINGYYVQEPLISEKEESPSYKILRMNYDVNESKRNITTVKKKVKGRGITKEQDVPKRILRSNSKDNKILCNKDNEKEKDALVSSESFDDDLNVLNELKGTEIKSKQMEDGVALRMDELLCSFMQVMEDALCYVLQDKLDSRAFNTFSYPLVEILICLCDNMNRENRTVERLAERLYTMLLDCVSKTKMGGLKMFMTPKYFMRVLGYGRGLITSLKKIFPNHPALLSAEDSLRHLVEDIRKPNRPTDEAEQSHTPIRFELVHTNKLYYVKDRSEIVKYLQKHYFQNDNAHQTEPMWELFDSTKEQPFWEPNTVDREKEKKYNQANIIRTSGSNLKNVHIQKTRKPKGDKLLKYTDTEENTIDDNNMKKKKNDEEGDSNLDKNNKLVNPNNNFFRVSNNEKCHQKRFQNTKLKDFKLSPKIKLIRTYGSRWEVDRNQPAICSDTECDDVKEEKNDVTRKICEQNEEKINETTQNNHKVDDKDEELRQLLENVYKDVDLPEYEVFGSNILDKIEDYEIDKNEPAQEQNFIRSFNDLIYYDPDGNFEKDFFDLNVPINENTFNSTKGDDNGTKIIRNIKPIADFEKRLNIFNNESQYNADINENDKKLMDDLNISTDSESPQKDKIFPHSITDNYNNIIQEITMDSPNNNVVSSTVNKLSSNSEIYKEKRISNEETYKLSFNINEDPEDMNVSEREDFIAKYCLVATGTALKTIYDVVVDTQHKMRLDNWEQNKEENLKSALKAHQDVAGIIAALNRMIEQDSSEVLGLNTNLVLTSTSNNVKIVKYKTMMSMCLQQAVIMELALRMLFSAVEDIEIDLSPIHAICSSTPIQLFSE